MALTGRLIIDGTDAYTNYGVVLNNYAQLIQWPQYKAVETNNWHEEDGLQADLSNPVLAGRTFSLSFSVRHLENNMMAQSLLAMLAEQVYHTLYFPQLNKTFENVRYVSNSNFATNEKWDTLTLAFAQDIVEKPDTAIPEDYTAPQLGYTIDDCDFGLFGCTVTKGTRASMWKYANAKENQKQESKYVGGITYDSADGIHLSSRDITVNLHMHSSLALFWSNWNALWSLVFKVDSTKGTSAAVRVVEGDGMEFQCYYKSNAVSRFLLLDDGEVWCDFTITFSVLAYNRGADWFYLATQASEQVTTEDQDVEDNPLYVRIGVPPSLLATLGANAEQQTAVKISQLPSSGSSLSATNGLFTIGVNNANQSVKIPLGDIMNALIDRVGFIYNIDIAHPLANGASYTLETALLVIEADTTVSDAVKSGMVLIFFDVTNGVWRVWQFQGRYSSETADQFLEPGMWIELAVSTNLAAKADKSYVDGQVTALQNAINAAAERGGVKRVTQAQYDAIPNKDASTIYAVTNASDTLRKIYLGTTLIAKADTSGNNAFTYTFPIIFQS